MTRAFNNHLTTNFKLLKTPVLYNQHLRHSFRFILQVCILRSCCELHDLLVWAPDFQPNLGCLNNGCAPVLFILTREEGSVQSQYQYSEIRGGPIQDLRRFLLEDSS
jgi:hypothetical protein